MGPTVGYYIAFLRFCQERRRLQARIEAFPEMLAVLARTDVHDLPESRDKVRIVLEARHNAGRYRPSATVYGAMSPRRERQPDLRDADRRTDVMYLPTLMPVAVLKMRQR